jgi:hypothetical protein
MRKSPGEHGSLFRKPIHVGRPHILQAVAAHTVCPQCVDSDEQHIWLRFYGFPSVADGGNQQSHGGGQEDYQEVQVKPFFFHHDDLFRFRRNILKVLSFEPYFCRQLWIKASSFSFSF